MKVGNKQIITEIKLMTVGIFLILSCTSNPFFDNKVESGGNRTVRGTVQLMDGAPAENVFVWLEGFNISARTDKTGKFKLTLPLPQTQPGGGLTGLYKLFYYVGNYQYQTSNVVVRRGRFAYDTEAIDKNGNITKTIVLRKLLDIKTVIEPDTIVLMKMKTNNKRKFSKTNADTIWETSAAPDVTVHILLTPKRQNVQIQYYMLDNNVSACAGFSDLNEPEANVRFLFSTSRRVLTIQSVPSQTALVMTKRWSYTTLKPGRYAVLPFILIVQDGIPDALYSAFGEYAFTANSDYLNIPFKETRDTLHIIQILF